MKLILDISDEWIEKTYGEENEHKLKVKDELWEKVCDVCETGDNFSLTFGRS